MSGSIVHIPCDCIVIVLLLLSSVSMRFENNTKSALEYAEDSKEAGRTRGQGGGNVNWTLVSNSTMGIYNGIDVGLDSKPVFGDMDADGDLDLVVGENDGTLNYFKNEGGDGTDEPEEGREVGDDPGGGEGTFGHEEDRDAGTGNDLDEWLSETE